MLTCTNRGNPWRRAAARAAYASMAGSLWRLDLRALKGERLTGDGVSHLAEGRDGDLYYTRGTKLYRWKF
ncbi:hypothetical protein [Spongiactinospora sp. 9N601]|uniref:hypothetical protein n=1 Tax=Spongiactinospora sp. 9N601 TaxID=3375149 RepID=UPI0037A82C4C